jgi:uncharacterized protein YkwD
VRRFIAIGCVVALVLLTAEALVIYASAQSSPQTRANAVSSRSATGAPRDTLSTKQTTATVAATATPRGDFVARVITRTNAYRVANGCPALTPNAILMGTAQGHSEEMALGDYVGHNSADGTSPWDRIKAAGYNYRLVAENIAWGATLPEQVVDAWFFETPPNDAHRKNILNCGLREIGVGYYYLANVPGKITAHTYWTQDFGTLTG